MAIKIKRQASRPSALGAYIFAGGFTSGVRRHFDVVAHLENGPFGVATAKRNFSGLAVHEDPASWPIDEVKRGVKFVYCNPPCAPWSSASSGRAASWKDDERTSCVADCFGLLKSMADSGLEVWCFESVRGAYTKGREMIDEMVAEARQLGFKATFLLSDAQEHGVPQVRKRFFLVLSRVEIDWQPTGKPHMTPCGGVFDQGLPDVPVSNLGGNIGPIVHLAKQGQKYQDVFNEIHGTAAAGYKNPGWKGPAIVGAGRKGGVKGRPGFLYERLDPKKPCPALTGSATKVHPTLNRFCSVPEYGALGGFPREFEFVGAAGAQYAQVAKGVMPPVAEYLAERVAAAIAAGNAPANLDPEEVMVFHDRVQRSAPGKPKHKQPPEDAKDTPAAADVTESPPDEAMHGLEPDGAATDVKPKETDVTTKQGFTPPGKRQQNLDRRFDQTQLKSTGHGQTVHRDYAAHFFRWGWATKFIDNESRVLDIGCGQEQPLVRVLGHHMAHVPELYVGVDLNKIKKKSGNAWVRVYDEFNFVDHASKLTRFDHGTDFTVATCFEVIEHMHKADGLKMLKNIRDLMSPTKDHVILLSTPFYDGKKMAANHIHEYTEEELRETIEKAGLEVVRQHGTFASWNDMKRAVTKDELALLEELKQFHSWDVLACFMAPKYPKASRNIAWVLRRAKGATIQKGFGRSTAIRAGMKYER